MARLYHPAQPAPAPRHVPAIPFSFAWPWALLLLLPLPAWWLWRRRRRPPAIVFSRVGTLAKGPRTGKGIARALFVLRNVLLIGMIVALARPRTAGRAESVTS